MNFFPTFIYPNYLDDIYGIVQENPIGALILVIFLIAVIVIIISSIWSDKE